MKDFPRRTADGRLSLRHVQPMPRSALLGHVLKHVLRDSEDWGEVLEMNLPTLDRSWVDTMRTWTSCTQDVLEAHERAVALSQQPELLFTHQVLLARHPLDLDDVTLAFLDESPNDDARLHILGNTAGLPKAARRRARLLCREGLWEHVREALRRDRALTEEAAADPRFMELCAWIDRSLSQSARRSLGRAFRFMQSPPRGLWIEGWLDHIEARLAGTAVIAAYEDRIWRAAEQAGLRPRHCVYSLRSRGRLQNECYIDDDGVTLSLSPEKRRLFQLRTCYRPVQGVGALEKRLEADERRRTYNPLAVTAAIDDFAKWLGRHPEPGVEVYHQEDTWRD
ncbi:MAG TPA: hypothetical protein QGF58_20065 [Myxococcota bacterium]|nr:hypothetical protein [Myxococcota bacterium]